MSSSDRRPGDLSLRETKPSEEVRLLSGKMEGNNDRGCCNSPGCGAVLECLKGEGERPSLPEPKRPAQPLTHTQYELQECFPCVFKPLHYFVLDRFPFLRWALQYNLRWLLADVVAGLTVGLMVVPQGLAYAKIANLPLKVRLVASYRAMELQIVEYARQLQVVKDCALCHVMTSAERSPN